METSHPQNLEKLPSNNSHFESLVPLILDLVKMGKSEDFESRLFAASELKAIHNSFVTILKQSKNPFWASEDGQRVVDLWLETLKKLIEDI